MAGSRTGVTSTLAGTALAGALAGSAAGSASACRSVRKASLRQGRGMPAVRDPRSVAYDPVVRRVLLAAIEARKNRRPAEFFVSSPPRDFQFPDKGGLTKDERAFTRSVYYQTYRVPVNEGLDPEWSAKIAWGKIERRGTRWGRAARVRLYRYGYGYRHAAKSGQPWITDAGGGSFADGSRRSAPGARIDG